MFSILVRSTPCNRLERNAYRKESCLEVIVPARKVVRRFDVVRRIYVEVGHVRDTCHLHCHTRHMMHDLTSSASGYDKSLEVSPTFSVQ